MFGQPSSFPVTEGSAPTSTTLFPLGPYHPALTQPLGLALRLRAETIAGVGSPRTGYCRRGIADLVEGASLDDALAVIERSCSLAGTTHRIAFCQAVEVATGAAVPEHARVMRIFFAELERLLARLWLLATVSRAAGQPAPLRDALEQREALFEALEEATGQRHYWAVAVPGGVREDVNIEPLDKVIDELNHTLEIWRAATGPHGPLGRAGHGVGTLSAERAAELKLAGIAAAGSGVAHDLRRDEPYGGYRDINYDWPAASEGAGDTSARTRAAVEDCAQSLGMARAAFDALGQAATKGAGTAIKRPSATVEAETHLEGPHGPVTLALALNPDLTVTQVRVETPVGNTLAALSEALEGRLVSQAPAILASLDLCMECLDF
jgi:Ni,Fe-hydrogenase III large subunit